MKKTASEIADVVLEKVGISEKLVQKVVQKQLPVKRIMRRYLKRKHPTDQEWKDFHVFEKNLIQKYPRLYQKFRGRFYPHHNMLYEFF